MVFLHKTHTTSQSERERERERDKADNDVWLSTSPAVNDGTISMKRVDRKPMEWVHGIFPTLPSGWFQNRMQV
jgi:hypothetical protein